MAEVEARIAEDRAKKKEIERKRAEGEVIIFLININRFLFVCKICVYVWKSLEFEIF